MPATEYIEAALRAKLDAATTSVASGRVYPNQRPEQITASAVVFFLLEEEALDATLEDPGSLYLARYQVDCYGKGLTPYETAKSLARLIKKKKADGGLAGEYGAWTYTGASIWVQECQVGKVGDDYIPPTIDTGKGEDVVSLNVTVSYERADGN